MTMTADLVQPVNKATSWCPQKKVPMFLVERILHYLM